MLFRIFLKKIIKLLIYLLSFFPIFFLFILYPIFKIRLSLQSSERLGEIASQMEIYLSERKLFKKSSYIDIFILNDVISNKTFIQLLKTKVFIFPTIIFHPIYKVLNFLAKNIFFFNKFILITKRYDNNFSIERTNANIVPDNTFIKKGENFLKMLSIPLDAKIICLIVRDSEYLKQKFPAKNFNYHSYRNSNIETYKLAIDEATKRGFYVFRMGEAIERKLNFDNKKFFDYSSDYRSDFLDIYLAFKCTFVITTSTGWDQVPAFTFRKPVVWTNIVPVGDLNTYSSKFLFSFKLHYDKINKKFLNLKEMRRVGYALRSDFYQKANIELIDNGPEDIKNLTLEMIDILDKKITYSNEDNQLQNEFWNKYVEYFTLENCKSNYQISIDPLRCSKKRLLNNKIISRIGKNFLNKNKFLLY
jgi:putative glycosyltransferase (TIGR04372 family)